MHEIKSSIAINFVSHHIVECTDRKRGNHETESVCVCFNEIMLAHGGRIDVMLAKWTNQPSKYLTLC